jgi:hypothetical protein
METSTQLLLVGLLSYSLIATFSILMYCTYFDDMKYHWTWSVNGKLLIPYTISAIIGYVVSFIIIINDIISFNNGI